MLLMCASAVIDDWFQNVQVIFTHFQYSDEAVLEPTVLREALAKTFEDTNRFQIGEMEDAAECFVCNSVLYLMIVLYLKLN